MRRNYVPKWILCLAPGYYLMKDILAFSGLRHTHSTHIRMLKFGAKVQKEIGSFRNIYDWNGYQNIPNETMFMDDEKWAYRYELLKDLTEEIKKSNTTLISTPTGCMQLVCEFKKGVKK